MITASKRLCLLTFFLAAINTISAQEKENKKDSSYFKASISYLTNAVYYGRKDSVNLAYITPSLGYYHKTGLYASVGASYLVSAAGNRIDLFSIDAGYDGDIAKNLSASVYASKYFYNSSSTAVQSDAKGGLGGSLTFDPGIVALSGGVDLLFSSKTDVFITLSLAHNFYIDAGSNLWTISPTATVNFGSQNYYQGNKRNKLRQGNNAQVSTYNKFSLLDYEFSVPVSYDAKKWGLFFTPTFSIPKNPVTYTTILGNTIVVEKLENTFYAEAGVYFKF